MTRCTQSYDRAHHPAKLVVSVGGVSHHRNTVILCLRAYSSKRSRVVSYCEGCWLATRDWSLATVGAGQNCVYFMNEIFLSPEG